MSPRAELNIASTNTLLSLPISANTRALAPSHTQLAAAVSRLSTAMEVANARVTTVAVVVGIIGSVVSCVGTWVIMIRFGH